jgi:hypothetical protein
VLDCAKMLEEQALINQWSEEERSVFFDKFLQFERHPERFHKIAQALGGVEGIGRKKNHGDVVRYYYQNKKKPTFSKEVSRRRSKKNLLKQAQAAERKKAAPEPKDKGSKSKAKAKKSPKGPTRSPARSDTDQSEDEVYDEAARGTQEELDGDQDGGNKQQPRSNKAHWTVPEEQIFVGIYKEFHTAEGRTLRNVAANSASVDFNVLTAQFDYSKSDVQLRNLWQKYDDHFLTELHRQDETGDISEPLTDEEVLEQAISNIRAKKQRRKQGVGSSRSSPAKDLPAQVIEPQVEHEADDDIASREAAVLNLLMAATESSDNSEATAAAALLANAHGSDSPMEQPQQAVVKQEQDSSTERPEDSAAADSSMAEKPDLSALDAFGAAVSAMNQEGSTENAASGEEKIAIKIEETSETGEKEDMVTEDTLQKAATEETAASTDSVMAAGHSAKEDDQNEDETKHGGQKLDSPPNAGEGAAKTDADEAGGNIKDIDASSQRASETEKAEVPSRNEVVTTEGTAEAVTESIEPDDATAMDVEDFETTSSLKTPEESVASEAPVGEVPAAPADAD